MKCCGMVWTKFSFMMQSKVWLLWEQQGGHLGKGGYSQNKFLIFDADSMNKTDTNNFHFNQVFKSATFDETSSAVQLPIDLTIIKCYLCDRYTIKFAHSSSC